MHIIFNQLGAVIQTDIEPIRQGDSNHILRVTFQGKRNFDYLARFNITRPDGAVIQNVLMNVDSEEITDYVKELDQEFYFAVNGNATLTILLVNESETQIASGQVTIPIEQTDVGGDPTITREEYEELCERVL